MKITRFWAKGFRSLHDVDLDGLGAFNVFYGPNGSGKSNVLAGMEMLFALLPRVVDVNSRIVRSHGADAVAAAAREGSRIDRRDLSVQPTSKQVVLGASVMTDATGPNPIAAGQPLEVEVIIDWSRSTTPQLWLSRLDLNGQPMARENANFMPGAAPLVVLTEWLPRETFGLIDADRFPKREILETPHADIRDIVAWHLENGRLKSALFVAYTSLDAAYRERGKRLRDFLQGEPLKRPSFDCVQDPRTREVDLREPLGRSDVSLDLAGLGIAQIYAVLAGVLLSNARSLGLEEPEAHLHAPTSGRHLRELLKRAVDEGHIDQLFIATHSNLFDLDPDGYWDVSLVDGATKIERRKNVEIDDRHLFEPGPARHALMQHLEHADPSEVIVRRPTGAPITAAELLDMLARNDADALDFVRTLNDAAFRMIRLQSRRPGGAT